MALRTELLASMGPGDVGGFSAVSTNTGLRKPGRPDFGLLLCPAGASASAVFTKNAFRSSCIEDAIPKLKNRVRAVAVFSGNANACTGPHGVAANKTLASALADAIGAKANQVLLSFTGVVGREFPVQKVKAPASAFAKRFAAKGPAGVEGEALWTFPKGILTTDTREKVRALRVQLGKGKSFTIAGCAKGAGMIHPNMATMLSYVTTDLGLTSAQCKAALAAGVDASFNRITVDGDTSTNDSCFLLASGASGLQLGRDVSPADFQTVLRELMIYLATEIARDGEGATKLIEVTVRGGRTEAMAAAAARAVSSSLLFQCAVHGGDPNYGRILVALGNAGLPLNLSKTVVALGSVALFRNNKVQTANIPKAAAYLKKETLIHVNVSLGLGAAEAKAWTCDISEEYVGINADYTT